MYSQFCLHMSQNSVGMGSKKGRRAGMGNATSLKIGQGHLRAMPTFQRWGTGINIVGIGHFWAIDNDKIWAFPGSLKIFQKDLNNNSPFQYLAPRKHCDWSNYSSALLI